MTIEEVRAIIPAESHADLDALIKGIQTAANPLSGVTDEAFSELLKGNDDLRKVLDKRVSTGIDTWQKNNLDKIYTERYAKEHPEETEAEKRIKALEVKSAEDTARADRAELRNKALELGTEKKLPRELIDYAIGDDLESTTVRINTLSDIFAARDKSVSERILKENGRTITEPEDTAKKYYTAEQIVAMSPAEQFANQSKVDASMSFLASQQ